MNAKLHFGNETTKYHLLPTNKLINEVGRLVVTGVSSLQGLVRYKVINEVGYWYYK